MQNLPKWVLVNPLPAIYDFESVTPLQQTARVYGAMQEMIKEYNNFVNKLNEEIERFTGSSEAEISNFKKYVEKRIRCQFEKMDTAFAKMKVDILHYADGKIESTYEQYLNGEASRIISEMIATGNIEITLVYDPETESLNVSTSEV